MVKHTQTICRLLYFVGLALKGLRENQQKTIFEIVLSSLLQIAFWSPPFLFFSDIHLSLKGVLKTL